ncbi:hypothetical protein TYRP_008577 [Tyrophagus putrescentiae]|nr:hypothetical protein TYRP_008577 [Tyrophagus putrescentiae]
MFLNASNVIGLKISQVSTQANTKLNPAYLTVLTPPAGPLCGAVVSHEDGLELTGQLLHQVVEDEELAEDAAAVGVVHHRPVQLGAERPVHCKATTAAQRQTAQQARPDALPVGVAQLVHRPRAEVVAAAKGRPVVRSGRGGGHLLATPPLLRPLQQSVHVEAVLILSFTFLLLID